MVTLAGLQNVVAGGGGNDGQGDGVARPAIRGWTLKSTRRVVTSGRGCTDKEREREEGRERRKESWEQEREVTQENLRPPVNSYRTSYRVRARALLAHVRGYTRSPTHAQKEGELLAHTHACRDWYIASENSRTP